MAVAVSMDEESSLDKRAIEVVRPHVATALVALHIPSGARAISG